MKQGGVFIVARHQDYTNGNKAFKCGEQSLSDNNNSTGINDDHTVRGHSGN